MSDFGHVIIPSDDGFPWVSSSDAREAANPTASIASSPDMTGDSRFGREARMLFKLLEKLTAGYHDEDVGLFGDFRFSLISPAALCRCPQHA